MIARPPKRTTTSLYLNPVGGSGIPGLPAFFEVRKVRMWKDWFRATRLLGIITVLIVSGFGGLQPARGSVNASENAVTRRVATSGNDSSGCGSSSIPCQSIQYAVNISASGDTILVASGTYTYKSSADTCSFLTTRAVVCMIDKDLSILGGYTPSNWSVSNPVANPTVIDGGNSRRGVAIIAYNSTASLRLEGFTIQNGLAQGTSSGGDFYTYAFGGGMWAQNSAVYLSNVTFWNNRAIGGNTSEQYGGAGSGGGLAIQSTKNGVISTLDNIVFDGNLAQGGSGSRRGGLAVGGGLYTYQSALIGTNIELSNNRALAGGSSGSGVDSIMGLHADALGGGAGFQIGSNINLSNLQVIQNQALGGNAGSASGARAGGGFGGGLHIEKSDLVVNDAQFRGNVSTGGRAAIGGMAFGGALFADATFATLDRILVVSNDAISGPSSTGGLGGTPAGGGAYLTAFDNGGSYSASIINSVFADNIVRADHPVENSGGYGGGLLVQSSTLNLIHSTVADNHFTGSLVFGQAIQIQGAQGESGTPGVANIQNTIIAGHIDPNNNSSAVTVARGSTANFAKGIFSGNTNNTNANGKPASPGTITGLNTMMQIASVGFASPGGPNWNYHLEPGSPAIDQANDLGTQIDIDGQPRPFNRLPDIGADEYSETASTQNYYISLPLLVR